MQNKEYWFTDGYYIQSDVLTDDDITRLESEHGLLVRRGLSMRKLIALVLLSISFPFYSAARAFAVGLHLEGVEDMPTIREWFDIDTREDHF